jgi:hypothetical protein
VEDLEGVCGLECVASGGEAGFWFLAGCGWEAYGEGGPVAGLGAEDDLAAVSFDD